ncbi:hypothetical protein HAX54_014022 [Datura stramonium]|uniref:Uncharacterized protein n=1 Tax=Datura stramonium TaxID=4076 RepID=A0ABS8TMC4_DATST|nr:hypothetical protein [Datura stramonium]
MFLSRGALLWLCKRLQEASAMKGKAFKSWRCWDLTTYIYCSLKFNKFGWNDLIAKIEGLINRERRKELPEAGGIPLLRKRGEGSYKEAIQVSRWSPNAPTSADSGDRDPLRRSLMEAILKLKNPPNNSFRHKEMEPPIDSSLATKQTMQEPQKTVLSREKLEGYTWKTPQATVEYQTQQGASLNEGTENRACKSQGLKNLLRRN